MTASIRLSLRAAKDLFHYAIVGGCPRRPIAALEAAIARASRASTTRRTLAKPRQAKRAAKKEKWAEIREEVMRRAGGQCECGCGRLGPLEADHFFGKARLESVPTVWALSPRCHLEKTRNHPSPASWFVLFEQHCRAHGYVKAESLARNRRAFVEARGTP